MRCWDKTYIYGKEDVLMRSNTNYCHTWSPSPSGAGLCHYIHSVRFYHMLPHILYGGKTKRHVVPAAYQALWPRSLCKDVLSAFSYVHLTLTTILAIVKPQSKGFSPRIHYLTFQQMLPAPTAAETMNCSTRVGLLFIGLLTRPKTPVVLELCVFWSFYLIPIFDSC